MSYRMSRRIMCERGPRIEAMAQQKEE